MAYSTYFGLLAEFGGRAQIPLEKVAERYFGICAKIAASRALAQRLPVPAYRAVRSQKASWLVNVADLAAYLDECRERAMRDWRQVNE